MKYITRYFKLIILLSILSCEQNRDNFREMADEEMVTPTTEQKADDAVERKLIKEGRVEFESNNLNTTRKTIFEAVNKYNGYISSDQEFKTSDRRSNIVIIRVPANNFDDLLKDATQGVEKFESKEIDVKDVTEEFLDIQARLKTKKELESRFVELLKKANSITEILEIEKQIGQLRSEIESIEGRLNYLQNKISFSTLTMSFYETSPNQTEFSDEFKNGFRNGWNNLIWFFVALTNIWPFILLGVLLIIGIKFYRRMK